MPSAAASASAEIPRDLPIVKVETLEGLFAKPLSVGIVCIVVMLLSKSSGAFLQSRRRVRAPSALGRVGPSRRARNHTSRWAAGPSKWPPTLFFSKAFPNLIAKSKLVNSIEIFLVNQKL